MLAPERCPHCKKPLAVPPAGETGTLEGVVCVSLGRKGWGFVDRVEGDVAYRYWFHESEFGNPYSPPLGTRISFTVRNEGRGKYGKYPAIENVKEIPLPRGSGIDAIRTFLGTLQLEPEKKGLTRWQRR